MLVDEVEQRLARSARPWSRRRRARSRRAARARGGAGEDRIEHRADGVGQRPAVDHRDRRADAAAAAEEARAVGLELRLADRLAFDDGEMRGPDLGLVGERAPARRQQRADLGDDIRSATNSFEKAGCATSARWRRQHELGIGGELDLARAAAGLVIETRRTSASSSAETSTSSVVVSVPSRRMNSARSSVKVDVVAVGLDAARLIAGGPDVAAVDVAQEDVGAPVVARRVLAPARDRQIAPAAVAGAGGGQHHGVAAVRQQMRARRGDRAAMCSRRAARRHRARDRARPT